MTSHGPGVTCWNGEMGVPYPPDSGYHEMQLLAYAKVNAEVKGRAKWRSRESDQTSDDAIVLLQIAIWRIGMWQPTATMIQFLELRSPHSLTLIPAPL